MSAPLPRRAVLLGLLLVAQVAQATAAESPTVVLASTTSVDNSGLLGRILPVFTAQTGIAVRVLALGTGRASPQGNGGYRRRRKDRRTRLSAQGHWYVGERLGTIEIEIAQIDVETLSRSLTTRGREYVRSWKGGI